MRVIVMHPDQQHSYKLASAIDKSGHLYKYITTVYYKKGSLTYYISKVLPSALKRKAVNRHTNEIEDIQVLQFCEGFALLKLLFQNISFLNRWYNCLRYRCADKFAKKVANYAIKEQVDMVITYDDCSPLLFEILKVKASNIIRVLDVSAANREYMKNIYHKDAEIAPSFAKKLKRETPQVWDNSLIKRNKREIELADYYLAPSDFVVKSLKYSGVEEKRIFLCPYGADTSLFKIKEYKSITSPIKFVYLGGITELKGIYYLLEAFWDISPKIATLSLIGDAGLNSIELEKYKNKYDFLGRIFHQDLPKVLGNYDVFIFPSLGDSFSFACVEAAASGLPLIVTENTGMKDYVSEGEEGFVVPIQSIDALKEKIQWYINNSDQIRTMGIKSSKMANSITWDNYNEAIKEFIDSLALGV